MVWFSESQRNKALIDRRGHDLDFLLEETQQMFFALLLFSLSYTHTRFSIPLWITCLWLVSSGPESLCVCVCVKLLLFHQFFFFFKSNYNVVYITVCIKFLIFLSTFPLRLLIHIKSPILSLCVRHTDNSSCVGTLDLFVVVAFFWLSCRSDVLE